MGGGDHLSRSLYHWVTVPNMLFCGSRGRGGGRGPSHEAIMWSNGVKTAPCRRPVM